MAKLKFKDRVNEFSDYYATQTATTVRTVAQKGSIRHLELHPSSFPYCFVRHFRDICLFPPSGTYEMPFSMEFYTSVGTTVHTVIQTSLGYGGRMLGDWVCPDCKTVKHFKRKPECPECGALMTYEELGVRIGKRTVGHVDGVFRCSDGRYIVIDYKTSSVKNIEYYRRTGEGFPYHHNVEQIRSYCYYLKRLYDIDIAGYLLVYCARDNIMQYVQPVGADLSEQDLIDIGKEMKMWDTQHDRVVRASKLEDIMVIIDQKPCKSYEDYESRYHDKFNPCPLAAVCFSKGNKLLAMELEICIDSADHLPLTTEPLAEVHH